jgi:DNA segregation ATPase FtsK/SpoIIIE, S-DNA-T family
MTALALIGAVGAAWLKRELRSLDGLAQGDSARFLLDLLEPQQIAAIVRACAATPELASALDIKIPRTLAFDEQIPDALLTDASTVWFRNRPPEEGKSALLLASAQDDRRESLAELTCLGAVDLMRAVDLWVLEGTATLDVTDTTRSLLTAALTGLTEARSGNATLSRFASFVSEVALLLDNGLVPIDALGRALPLLRLPKDTSAFATLKERERLWKNSWRRRWEQLYVERASLLVKLQKSRQVIERADLEAQFERVKDEIPLEHHNTVKRFIGAPPQWCEEADAFSRIEWDIEHASQIFTGLKTVSRTHIAAKTRRHFEDRDPQRLTDEDAAYLAALEGKRVLKDPGPEDRSFFERHAHFLGEDPGLKTTWDRFIYGTSVACTDLLVGLIDAVERLYGRNANHWKSDKRVELRIDLNGRKPFRDINEDAARLFLCRYSGLSSLAGANFKVTWSHFTDYDAFLEEESERGNAPTRSDSRKANTIRLELNLVSTDHAVADAVQILWSARPDAISRQLPDDLRRLASRPFLRLSVHPNRISSKGDLQRVTLNERATLEPVFGKDAGALVPARDGEAPDVAKEWVAAIEGGVARGGLSREQGSSLKGAWDRFATEYQVALQDYVAGQIASDHAVSQANAYGDLLRELTPLLSRDRLRQSLLEPLLMLGIVPIVGDFPAAIVAPWHPMRLVSTATKLRRVARFINHVLSAESLEFGDTGMFFKEFREYLTHPHAPELCVMAAAGRPTVLVVVSTLDDYSLAESPLGAPNQWRSQSDPQASAKHLLDTVDRYLELQPHEIANLSVALFNCDSAGLPTAVVQGLAERQEEDVHCNVILRHSDVSSLRRVYTDLIERADADPDAVIASESSRNFMANLRVGIQLEPPTQLDPNGARSVDIAFLDDVIARRAQFDVALLPESMATVAYDGFRPSQWSYRLPVGVEETTAQQYLACPEQTTAGREYLRCLSAIVRPPVAVGDMSYSIPVRRLQFSEEHTRRLLTDAHNLADWVVNYDDVLDPRQLKNQDIQIIRFRRDSTSGRNLIISSTAPTGLLKILVQRRLSELSTGLSETELHTLAGRFIEDATEISGEIVIRAAKRGTFAGELIGIVLSRRLVFEELGEATPQSWFFLDDYATWLGRKEGQIADLLSLSPSDRNGQPTVVVRATEAKYVTYTALSESRKKSRGQIEETVGRLRSALFEDPGRLDRDIWLSRLAELLSDGLIRSPNAAQWASLPGMLRAGKVDLDVRGYSHIFVSGPSDGPSVSDQQLLSPSAGVGALQEVFGPLQVRELVLRYAERRPLREVRETLGSDHPWTTLSFETLAPRPTWHVDDADRTEPPKEAKSDPADAPKSVLANRLEKGDGSPDSSIGPERVDKPSKTDDTRSVDGEPPTLPQTSTIQALILARGQPIQAAASDPWLSEIVGKLRRALSTYDLQSTIVGSRLTPNTALVRLQGSDRLTVKDIEQRRSQLLTTHGLAVVFTAARPGEVVVSIARPQREVVSLWNVWFANTPEEPTARANLSLLIGLKEIDGEAIYLNLTPPASGGIEHAPHTLIAGTTGSGKSVLIQNLLLDLSIKNDPGVVRVTIVDPKMGVDYFPLEHLPHLTEPVVTSQDRALQVLQGLVDEMERRYRLFGGPRVNKLSSYNDRVPPGDRLPWIIVVHDEFADWMQTEDYRDHVVAIVNRLSVKARAAGIHLIFAAQRPDVSVMPMQLRDNLGNRLILRVEGEGTSEFALGEKGAERLLGRGHIAIRLQGEEPQLAQVPWMSPEDAEQVVASLGKT